MMFDKKEYEEISDYFIKELDTRENKMDAMLLELDKINKKYAAQSQTVHLQDDGEEYHKAA